MYFIYKITNKETGLCYIGLTNNIARRRARHFTDLRCNRHDNAFLQKAFNISGEENFDFEVLFEGNVTSEEISLKEREFIAKYDSYHNGYNQNEGGNFGPSNGGSQLTKSDIFNILSALEFKSRPGQVLADMYDVTRTTISRIKKGVSHNQYKEEYDALSLEERQHIYNIFEASCNFNEKKAYSTIIQSKRKLNEQQVHLILLNEERGRIVTQKELMARFGISSSNTFITIKKGQSYQDFSISYSKLTEKQKDELASLLRKQ